jgi:hypothetical protein
MKKTARKAAIFFLMACIILNPYTIFGRPALFVSAGLTIYAFIIRKRMAFFITRIPFFLILFLISLWGAINSHLNNIEQLNHPLAVLSLLFVTISALAISNYSLLHKIDFSTHVKFVLYAITLNSLIIILEVASPELRNAIESILAPAGNIDWEDGFRYRGIAASGGAGLSLCTPIAFVCLIYLFNNKNIKIIETALHSIILLVAVLNIGRTGLVLSLATLFFYTAFILYRASCNPDLFKRGATLICLLLAILILNYNFLSNYLTTQFGEGFTTYAFEFLLQGRAGIESEGTVSTLANFLSAMPLELPEALLGVGFYGGSDFSPWTDSGYSRMFLSVGYPLGVLFYITLAFIYFPTSRQGDAFFLAGILALLLIAEAKETLLYSGAGSRIYVLLFVSYYSINYSRKSLRTLKYDKSHHLCFEAERP